MALVFVDPTHYDQLNNDHPNGKKTKDPYHHPPTRTHNHFHHPRPSKVTKPMATALALPTPTAITTSFVHELKDLIGRNIPACKKHHSNYYYKLNENANS